MSQDPIDAHAVAQEAVLGEVRDWMVAGAESYAADALQARPTSLIPQLLVRANPAVMMRDIQLPPPPVCSLGAEVRHTARLWFSEKDDFSTDAVARIIHAMKFVTRPLVFTCTGNSGGITHWLTAHRDDMPMLANLIHASFPLSHLDTVPIGTYCDRLVGSSTDALVYRSLWPPLQFWGVYEDTGLGFGPMYSTMEGLSRGEFAVYQVVFCSMPHEWCSLLRRMATAETVVADGLKDYKGWAFSPEFVRKVQTKVGGPLFCAAVRMAILGSTPARESPAIGGLQLSVGGIRFSGGPLRLITEADCGAAGISKNELLQGFIDGTVHQHGIVLAPEELALLVRFPGESSLNNRHILLDRAPSLIGDLTAKDGVLLGTEYIYGREVPVLWSDAIRCLSIMLTGAPGSGKSTELSSIIVQIVNSNPAEGVCLIDPHDTAIEGILMCLDEGRLEDCILHTPMDDDYILCLPLFTCEAAQEIDTAAGSITRQICSLFAKTDLGFNIMRGIRNMVRTVLLCEDISFVEARELLEPSSRGAALRERVCAQIDDEFLIDYWENGYQELDKASIGRIRSKIDHLLEPKRLRRQLANRIRKLTYKQIINEGKIFLAATRPEIAGVDGTDIIGALHLTSIQSAAHVRAGTQGERPIFTIAADEFGNYSNPRTVPHSLRTLRKCDVSQILVTQNVDALSDEIKTAMGNINTHVTFLQGWDDAQVYFRSFSGVIPLADLMARGVGEAFVKIGNRLASIRCPVPKAKRQRDIIHEILQQTRNRYCVSVKEFRERMVDEHHVSVAQMKEMDLL